MQYSSVEKKKNPRLITVFAQLFIFCAFRNQDLKPKEVRYGVVYRVDFLAEVTNLNEAAYQSIMRLNYTSDLQVVGVEVNSVCILYSHKSV